MGDEVAIEDASKRMHESHTRLFDAGRVVGGRVFGYRDVDVNGVDRDGRPLRSHVEREVNPAEAAVVVRISNLYDSGLGLKKNRETADDGRRTGADALSVRQRLEACVRMVAVHRSLGVDAGAVSRLVGLEQDQEEERLAPIAAV